MLIRALRSLEDRTPEHEPRDRSAGENECYSNYALGHGLTRLVSCGWKSASCVQSKVLCCAKSSGVFWLLRPQLRAALSFGLKADGRLGGVESESDAWGVSRNSDIEDTEAGSRKLLSGRSWGLFRRRKEFRSTVLRATSKLSTKARDPESAKLQLQYESSQLRPLTSFELPASVSEGPGSRLTPQVSLSGSTPQRSLSAFSPQLTRSSS